MPKISQAKKYLQPTWFVTFTEHPEPTSWVENYLWYEHRVNHEIVSQGVVHFLDIAYMDIKKYPASELSRSLRVCVNDCNLKCDIIELDFKYLHEFFMRITESNHKDIAFACKWLADNVLNQQKAQSQLIQSLQHSFDMLRKVNTINEQVTKATKQPKYITCVKN